MKKILIISDKKPGHLNQSISLARIMDWNYDILEIEFKSNFHRLLSYFFDKVYLYKNYLFKSYELKNKKYDIIVSTGSLTYYANKLLTKKYSSRNIAILSPRGYRLNFDYIICPKYDRPPNSKKIIRIPVNISSSNTIWYNNQSKIFLNSHSQKKRSIGIIIGGDNKFSQISEIEIFNQIKMILDLTPNYEHWITTSRRTSPKIDAVINKFKFDYKLIYNDNPNYNPVPAFINLCSHLFITSDSTSMISESVSAGSAYVSIIPTKNHHKSKKFSNFINYIVKNKFAGNLTSPISYHNKKINFEKEIKKYLKDI